MRRAGYWPNVYFNPDVFEHALLSDRAHQSSAVLDRAPGHICDACPSGDSTSPPRTHIRSAGFPVNVASRRESIDRYGDFKLGIRPLFYVGRLLAQVPGPGQIGVIYSFSPFTFTG